jgi:hypothetical protein
VETLKLEKKSRSLSKPTIKELLLCEIFKTHSLTLTPIPSTITHSQNKYLVIVHLKTKNLDPIDSLSPNFHHTK